MYGFYNKLLRVDLAAQAWTLEPISDDTLAHYLGGKGLGAYLLLEYGPTGGDPLAPESPFILTVGPATGTVLAPASRYALFAKSPLTGIFAESYAGGHVAPRVKATGYDAIILEGASDQPTYLEITDHGVGFHDAAPFWGMDAYQAEQALEAATGVPGAKAVVIGPAGEKQVPFAVVANDRGRQAGRTGLGAVLGAKKLKGLVFHGQAECAVYDPEGVVAYDRRLREKGKADAGARAYRELAESVAR